jgi:hypothetical protein
MTKKLLSCGALVSLLAVLALAARPTSEDEARKEKGWTVNDLSRSPSSGSVLPISNDVILQNSIDALKKTPNDQALKQRTLALARALAQPQPPSPCAWQFMIDQGVLKDGISFEDARRLLGSPTYQKNGEVRWYFNFRGWSDLGRLKDWKVYEG